MGEAPDLTLILGPVTPLALRLNALIRAERAALETAGCRAWPTRLATPGLRSVIEPEVSPVERGRRFAELAGEGQAVLAAIGFFGHPSGGLAGRDLLPDLEMMLAALAGPLSLRPARVVFTIDSLPAFFLAANSDALDAKVRETPWETLYDLSWTDTALELLAALPNADVAIASPKGAAVRSAEMMGWLFGAASEALSDPFGLLEMSVDEIGRDALAKARASGVPRESTLGELYDTFRIGPDPKERTARLGIDKLTATLLDQRLDEDLHAIRQIDRVTVF